MRRNEWLLRLSVWWLFALAIPSTGWAQTTPTRLKVSDEVRFEHLSAKQGLSHNTVLCIRQDREGFLWFGTKDGLNKYDGYNFTVYKPDPNDPNNTLGHSWVTDTHEDRQGRIWITTLGGGLHLMNKQTGRVTAFRIDPNQISDRNTCYNLLEDHQGILWISSQGGLNRFDPRTRKFTLYASPNKERTIIRSICEDRFGMLWVSAEEGLYQFDRQTGQFNRFVLDPGHPEKKEVIPAMYPDTDGMIWLASTEGFLYRLEPASRQLTRVPLPAAEITGPPSFPRLLYKDFSGHVWVTARDGNGLQRFNPRTGQWTSFQAATSRSGHLSSSRVSAVYLDRSGIVWVGTDNGLDKLLPQPKKFRTYQLIGDEQSSRLPENGIRALCIDHTGTFWLSNFAGGLYAIQLRTGQITRFVEDSSSARRLYSNRVNAIYEDRSGRLWVGGAGYLHRMTDRQKGTFVRYRCEIGIRAIKEDNDGMLWIAGRGIASFNPATGKFTYYRHNPNDSTSLGDEGLMTLLPSRSGAVWTASFRRGLSRLDRKTGKFTHYRPNYANPAGHLNDKDIRSLYEDPTGILWIGTHMGGLNRYDPKTKKFTAYTTREGLPNNHVVGIIGDGNGNLWLATNRGICRFNPTTRQVRSYDDSDGLQDNEFFETYTKSPGGELAFGGPNGFNVFSPASIRDNPQVPPVHITGFRVLNQPRVCLDKTIELSHEENFLSFEFVALNYVMPEKNLYAFQLANVDRDWVFCGPRRFTSYTNLDPGTYTFRVKGSNNDGVWNEAGATLTIVIHPPFWLTWWFISLSILAVAGLIYGGFRLRVRQIQKSEAQKTEFNKRLAEMELQALRAQMNPHFIFNSLNSINRFIMKNESEAASDYLSKFSKLIRLILQNSHSPTITLESELEALHLYLKMEALRFDGKFTFEIRCSEEVEPAYTEVPPMIIQPYVENAIWHGLMHKEGGGHITIELEQENGDLLCTVEDNGVGRKRAAELKSKSATRTKSMGMQITSHRLALSHSLTGKQPTVTIVDLVDTEGEPCGTRVVLRIPTQY